MKLFLSDLHLGSPLFKYKKELMDLVQNSDVDEIYILGDLFDVWEDSLENIIEEYKEFFDYLNDTDKFVVILTGNHDPSAEEMRNYLDVLVVSQLEIELFGKKTLLIHGDKFDTATTIWKWWHKLWFPIHYVGQRAGFNFKKVMRNLIHTYRMGKKGKDYNDFVLNSEEKIYENYKEDFDIVVCGHTHLNKFIVAPGLTYINTGSLMDTSTYLVCDNNACTFGEI